MAVNILNRIWKGNRSERIWPQKDVQPPRLLFAHLSGFLY